MAEVFEGVAAFYQQDFDVLGDAETERVSEAETLPGSYEVLGVSPLLGRALLQEDVLLGRRTTLISESFWSRRYGRDLDVLGSAITIAGRSYEIVIPAIHAAIAEAAPAATVSGATTGEEIARGALGRAKFNSLVIGVFSVMGLLLAAAGVFGVTSYTVGRRTREFGLRVALGARPVQVRQLVLRNAMFVAAAGIGIGLLAAVALTGSLSELLFRGGGGRRCDVRQCRRAPGKRGLACLVRAGS